MSTTSKDKKKRLGPDDFGYTFIGYEPPEGVVAETATVAEEEGKEVEAGGGTAKEEETMVQKEKFVYEPKKDPYSDVRLDDEVDSFVPLVLANLGAICCCLFVVLILVGAILIAVENYGGQEGNEVLLAGVIAFILASCACLCGCVALCVGCTAATVGSGANSVGLGGHGGSNHDPKEVKLCLRRLNDRYEYAEEDLNAVRRDVASDLTDIRKAERDEAKKKRKEQKQKDKELEKRVKEDLEAGLSVKDIRQKYRPVAFYVNFDGDVFLSEGLELLRKTVSLIVSQGKPGLDQAVVVVTSPGGSVPQYGLAASQLVRIRKAGIHLVVCIDVVAASGGYMLASVADKICAAPFALVGSIGVVTQIPNFQRFLNKHSVDAYLMTAGQYKRTIDVIGEVTEEGKQKLQEELDDIHSAFKDHIGLARPKLSNSMEEVGTGEAWLAVQAKEKGLVDEILTSDEYLESIRNEYDIIEIRKKHKRKLLDPDTFDLAGSIRQAVGELKKASSTPWSQDGGGCTPMAIS